VPRLYGRATKVIYEYRKAGDKSSEICDKSYLTEIKNGIDVFLGRDAIYRVFKQQQRRDKSRLYKGGQGKIFLTGKPMFHFFYTFALLNDISMKKEI